jgi:replicative DNA helicase
VSALTEHAVIGALVSYPDLITEVAQRLDVEDFAEPRARLVYAAMLLLHRAGDPVDWVLLTDEIDRAGDLFRIGTEYLVTVSSSCPLAEHLPAYVARVERDGAKRRGQTGRLPFKGAVRL